jgi:hypothetical protein
MVVFFMDGDLLLYNSIAHREARSLIGENAHDNYSGWE